MLKLVGAHRCVPQSKPNFPVRMHRCPNRYPTQPPMPYPHTTLTLAMSLDGKIADAQRQAARFSSAADLAHLEARVAEADGVLFGGGTLRAYGTTLSVRNPALIDQRRSRHQPDQPIQIVWSPSGHIDPQCRFFQQPIPRGLITAPAGAKPWQDTTAFDRLWVMPQEPPQPWDWPTILDQLYQAGIHRLALLGGLPDVRTATPRLNPRGISHRLPTTAWRSHRPYPGGWGRLFGRDRSSPTAALGATGRG